MDFAEGSSRRKNLFGSVNWNTTTSSNPESVTYSKHGYSTSKVVSNNEQNPYYTTNFEQIAVYGQPSDDDMLGTESHSSNQYSSEYVVKSPGIPIVSVPPQKYASGSAKTANLSVSIESESMGASLNDFHHIDLASACAFLGDDLSVHNVDPMSLNTSSHGFFKATSLENLSTSTSTVPMLMRMPSNPSRRNLDKFLESIPAKAWMMPLILACAPPPDLMRTLETFYITTMPQSYPSVSPKPTHPSSLPSISYPPSSSPPSPLPPPPPPSPPVPLSRITSSPGLSRGKSYSLSMPTIVEGQSETNIQHMANGKDTSNVAGSYFVGSLTNSPPDLSPNDHTKQNMLSTEGDMDKDSLRFTQSNISHRIEPSSINGCWRSLGVHLLTSDPTWVSWEPRLLLLLDNYLFECSPAAPTLLGFAQLNKSDVTNVLLRKVSSDSSSQGYSSNSSHPGERDHTLKHMNSTGNLNLSMHGGYPNFKSTHSNSFNGRTDISEQQIAIQISYLQESDLSSIRRRVWIRSSTIQEITELKDELQRVSDLGVDDVYDFTHPTIENTMLSSNRFTEVRVARRLPSQSNNALKHALKPHFNSSPLCSPVNKSCIPNHGGGGGGCRVKSSGGSHDYYEGSVNGRGTRSRSVENGTYPIVGNGSNSGSLSGLNIATNRSTEYGLSHISNNSVSVSPRNHHLSISLPTSAGAAERSPRGFHVAPYSVPSHSTRPVSYLFTSPSEDQKYCALKTVYKQTFLQRVKDGAERADSIVREVLCQSLVCQVGRAQGKLTDNLPIVQIYGGFETVHGFSMELELMQSEDMCDKLLTLHRLDEEDTRDIVCQVVDALIICRLAGVAHRDVKLSNITIARPPDLLEGLPRGRAHDAPMQVKLADFGMAGLVGYDGCLRGRCGTIGYVAPEILCSGTREGYGGNVDLFSLGVTAYTLLCGHEPFYGTDPKELKEANKNAVFDFTHHSWRGISIEAKDWISRALTTNQDLRITPSEALQHPWLAQSRNKRGYI